MKTGVVFCGGWGLVLVGVCTCMAFSGCGKEKNTQMLVSVTIDSVPESGASVLMAGVDQGVTPVTISGIASGDYEVVLYLERYRRTIEAITVTEEPEQTFSIEMKPITGSFTVYSKPEGAEVYLDGERAGVTPLINRTLQIGEYSYELRHPDYYPVENSFVVEDSFKMEFNHELRPLEAELTVFSRPSSSAIWLNNILQPEKTPAKFKLKPGAYLVSVYNQGFLQADELVQMEANAPQTVQLVLSKGAVPQGMVLVPAGEFTMGADERAPDERPTRKLMVKAFYIDRFEVTNQAFKVVFPEHKFPEGQDNVAAMGISWTQSLRYCESVGKRLPTEAEWEKAARGTDGREYPWGEVFDSTLANTLDSGIGIPTRVGHCYTSLSPYSCLDMSGNAYEWVMDWYEAYPGNQFVTKDYGQIFRVLRGGSYLTGKFEARCAARHFDRIESKRRDYGCRCAMDARE